ncbi:hypothetical protein [Nonomuraea sp. NPDC050643]|uniref:hypothetical protein n=1 Tax=Nonomuraea sp. NPDC050643 TaxID=3155660 RepID=UPI0033CC5B7C
MLFERRLREGVRDGSITLAFRRWKRAQVTAGGRYRMGDGLMAEVTAVEVVTARTDLTDEAARAAGYADRAALLSDLDARGPDPIHRVALHRRPGAGGGPGPRQVQAQRPQAQVPRPDDQPGDRLPALTPG